MCYVSYVIYIIYVIIHKYVIPVAAAVFEEQRPAGSGPDPPR